MFVVVATAAAALSLVLPAQSASAATGDVGFEGPSYSGTSQPASADKPESKLWYAEGSWWAVMFNSGTSRFDIYRLDRPTNTWVDTGVLVDSRTNTLADAQYDSTRQVLSVASHVATTGSASSGKPARLMRYSLSGGSWTLLSTTTIDDYSSESMTIDVDSTGAVWATWTQATSSSNAVYVAHNAGGTSAFGAPLLVPSADSSGNAPSPDDISSLVAFNNSIGVLWSNQKTSKFYWSVHSDGDADATWAKVVAFSGPSIADDHLNIKSLQSDPSGRVFAALKTSINDTSTDPTQPQVILGVYAGGTWTRRTVWTLADKVTRPVVMLSASTVYLAATAPESGGSSGTAGTIYQKTSPISSLSFTSGKGTPIMRDADSLNLNNVTSSKQNVTDASGLVWLATNDVTKRYWHSDTLAGSGTPTPQRPVASFSASPTSGTAPLSVQFTDSSTNTPTSWAWDFGDGTTSTAQNPSHQFTSAGSYSVTLTASNAAGSSTATQTVTATTGGGGGGGSTPAFAGASSAAVTGTATQSTLAVPAPSGAPTGSTLLAAVSSRGTPTITPPAGWTQVLATVDSTTSRTIVFSHVEAAGDPASYTFSFSKPQAVAAVVTAYTGVGSVRAAGGQANAASSSITAPSQTAVAGDRLVGFFATARTGTVAAPAGMTERAEATTPQTSSKTTVETADSAVTSTGATGAKAAVANGSSANIGQLVVLAPSGP